jgi:hypothetical protein
VSTSNDARHDIENLLFRYARAADALDAAAVVQVLGDATVDFAGQRAAGRQALQTMFADAFRDAPAVRHLISNVLIDVRSTAAGQAADVRASYTRWPTSVATGPLGLGDYLAAMSNDGAGWRFDRFTVRRVWTQPSPA